jgi:hypothetical protein
MRDGSSIADEGESRQLTDAGDRHEPTARPRGRRHASHVCVDGGDHRHHRDSRRNQPSHSGRETHDPFACFEGLVDECSRERAREPDPEHERQASYLIFQGHSLPDQFLARNDQRSDGVSRQRLHVYRLKEAGASQMRQASSVVPIGLVGRKRLERLIGLPAFDADHGEIKLAQPVKQDRRHSSGLKDDPTTARRFRQFFRNRLGRRRRFPLVNDRAFAVDDADVGFLHRDVRPAK